MTAMNLIKVAKSEEMAPLTGFIFEGSEELRSLFGTGA